MKVLGLFTFTKLWFNDTYDFLHAQKMERQQQEFTNSFKR